MVVIFWIAYVLTVAEFIASSVNTLRGSKMHLDRLKEIHFPLQFARILAWTELVAAVMVLVSLWVPSLRLVGGCILALCFIPITLWGVRAKRPASDILALLFFVTCALITGLYTF